MSSLIRTYVRRLLETSRDVDQQIDPDTLEIIGAYVQNSGDLDESALRRLARWVSRQNLTVPLRLERIERRSPNEFKNGRTVDYYNEVKSFSRAAFTKNEQAGHIAWKSTDRCIVVIERATRGWVIDYSIVDRQMFFDAAAEKEVLVTGRYRIAREEEIVEPGTYAPYGYRIPVVYLEES